MVTVAQLELDLTMINLSFQYILYQYYSGLISIGETKVRRSYLLQLVILAILIKINYEEVRLEPIVWKISLIFALQLINVSKRWSGTYKSKWLFSS